MPKKDTKVSPEEKLAQIEAARAAEPEPVPLLIRITGGLYDYSKSAWAGDSRPGQKVAVGTVEQFHAFHEALTLFLKVCTLVRIADVMAALKPLAGED